MNTANLDSYYESFVQYVYVLKLSGRNDGCRLTRINATMFDCKTISGTTPTSAVLTSAFGVMKAKCGMPSTL